MWPCITFNIKIASNCDRDGVETVNSEDVTLFLDWSDICHEMKGLEVLVCGTETLRTTYSSKNKLEPKPRAPNKLEGFFQSSAGKKMNIVTWFGFLPNWYVINPLCTSFQIWLFRILEEQDKSGQVESRPLLPTLHTELLLCVTPLCVSKSTLRWWAELSPQPFMTLEWSTWSCAGPKILVITQFLLTSKYFWAFPPLCLNQNYQNNQYIIKNQINVPGITAGWSLELRSSLLWDLLFSTLASVEISTN